MSSWRTWLGQVRPALTETGHAESSYWWWYREAGGRLSGISGRNETLKAETLEAMPFTCELHLKFLTELHLGFASLIVSQLCCLHLQVEGQLLKHTACWEQSFTNVCFLLCGPSKTKHLTGNYFRGRRTNVFSPHYLDRGCLGLGDLLCRTWCILTQYHHHTLSNYYYYTNKCKLF